MTLTEFQLAPADLSADRVWSHTAFVFTIAAILMGVGTLLYCLDTLRRRKDAVPLLMGLGGFGAALVAEPLLGHLGHLWWPRDYPGPSFTSFGSHVPGILPPIYAFYLGMLGILGYRLMSTGLTVRRVWMLWAVLVGTDFTLQIVAVNLKAYVYYGRQPFALTDVPLVGPVKNGTAYLLIGFLAWLLSSRARGLSKGLFLLVPLTGYLGGAISIAWPWYVAINSDLSKPVEFVIAAGTFVLSYLAVRGIAAVVASPASDFEQVSRSQRHSQPSANVKAEAK